MELLDNQTVPLLITGMMSMRILVGTTFVRFFLKLEKFKRVQSLALLDLTGQLILV